MSIRSVGDTKILEYVGEPDTLLGADASDIVGAIWGVEVDWVAVPAERFDPAFFDLSTKIAGDFLQKLVNYRVRLAILGDISTYVAASSALHDFVVECNRGNQVWFLDDFDALSARLQ